MGISSGGLVLLEEMKQELPPSEQKIADYILGNPEKTVRMTISELGEKSKTSSAAVTRLCKSLKLKGFQDLKLRINGDLGRKKEVGTRDIEPNEPVETTIDKVTDLAVQTLLETAELLDSDKMLRAVEKIKNAHSIHFFGVGASAIPAMDAQQKFLRINKTSTAFTDPHMGATVVANAKSGDVVMGISFSGETSEVVKILELAKEKGVTTISLTRYGQSTISEMADISLFTSPTKEANFRSGATSSRLAQLHVIDILFMSVASKQYESTIKYLDATRDAIKEIQHSTGRKKKKSND
ncbi:MurR/RpiR family transcriptional regulator [Jeotgalibacillus soli]|uniref:RpiR family transcriptional regulator n=1 Tax=Jeotgalibacillus soli TaxID=889306 RepID=A0A0C2RHC0_9BACL|nr:MurR/RpiR family transcriptional regulator [Jeotgalibacillus soli]KIL49550.1 RpiR family transcriptional regulator [Jeotgalibacillus soli]